MIRGIVAAVPTNIERNDDAKFVAATGVRERRIVTAGQDTLTLAEAAVRRLLEKAPMEFGSLIFVTQTPPYRMPDAACALAGALGFHGPAISIHQACAGYVVALSVARHMGGKSLVVAGDTVSTMVKPGDNSNRQLFGDCVTATAVDCTNWTYPPMNWTHGTDGSGVESLIADPFIRMNGVDVMNFALQRVPQLVRDVTLNAHVDWYLFHQANASLLNHLVKKLKLDPDSVPINIDTYGNTSSASIPLLMAHSECTQALTTKRNRVALMGFGAGFSYAGVLLDLDPLKVCERIEV